MGMVSFSDNDDDKDKLRRLRVTAKRTKKKKKKMKKKLLPSLYYDLDVIPSLNSLLQESPDTMKQVFKLSYKKLYCKCCTRLSLNADCDYCKDCLSLGEDPTRGLPKFLNIKYCEGCQGYAFTARTDFMSASPQSDKLLKVLLRRLDYHFFKLHLELISAKFVHTDSKKIYVELLLEVEAFNGVKFIKSHIVEYSVSYLACHSCSFKDIASDWNSIVQLRRHDADKEGRTYMFLQALLLRHIRPYKVKKSVRLDNGKDFYFANESDAKEFYDLLCHLAPVTGMLYKCVNASNELCIPAVVCPISREDLVYLPPNVSASLKFSGPLAICTKVTNAIALLDPMTSMQSTLSADDYWREPFGSLKTSKGLVDYIVLHVDVIDVGVIHSLADVQVARVSDFGSNDLVSTVRTHLGQILKPGDYALGYDLYGVTITGIEADKSSDSLPDVVLIKRSSQPTTTVAPKKNRSPEYEEFLKDLEKNPDAIFNLSLNSEKKQHTEVDSVKAGDDSDFDLDGLLADLDLGDP